MLTNSFVAEPILPRTNSGGAIRHIAKQFFVGHAAGYSWILRFQVCGNAIVNLLTPPS